MQGAIQMLGFFTTYLHPILSCAPVFTFLQQLYLKLAVQFILGMGRYWLSARYYRRIGYEYRARKIRADFAESGYRYRWSKR